MVVGGDNGDVVELGMSFRAMGEIVQPDGSRSQLLSVWAKNDVSLWMGPQGSRRLGCMQLALWFFFFFWLFCIIGACG